MRIAFLVQLPRNVSPGQRFRIEQFEPGLAVRGFQLDTFSFLNEKTYRILYRPGHIFQKITGVLAGFWRRLLFLFRASRYDYIFVQREAAPVGPPVIEWVLAKLLRKKIIYDFDDAIWIRDTSSSNRFAGFLKCTWKVKYICRWSYKVSTGNDFLANYARQYNRNVTLIPTCVDTQRRYDRTKVQDAARPVIGWTGSHSTMKYLDQVFPVLQELEKRYDFEFLVICDRPPAFQLASLRFIKWKEASEINDLLEMNIGIMPLVEDAWSQGKCGFKLIQYMALGIPAIASPIGVNAVIVEQNTSGFLCSTPEEWLQSMATLLKDAALRERMGKEGRKRIVASYSLHANEGLFLSLFA